VDTFAKPVRDVEVFDAEDEKGVFRHYVSNAPRVRGGPVRGRPV
jgi:hypothetical protein